ncbi:MAG TPA: E3 ubiquitin ligase family protein [Candidatus Obscuribacterales bacterium]
MGGLFWVGIVLCAVGVILFFVQRQQHRHARSLKLARTATVAELQSLAREIAGEIGGGSWRDYVKLTGIVRCDRPLQSELKQEACVHYEMRVSREYEEKVTRRDSDGNTRRETQRGSEVVAQNQRSLTFWLEDQTGQSEVNPDGAKIATVKILDEFQAEQGVDHQVSYGKFSRTVKRAGGDRRTLGYRYHEAILPVDQRVLVVGMISDSSGSLLVQKPLQPEQRFIISLKDDEALTKSADSSAKVALYSMVVSFAVGSLLLVLSVLL